MMHLMKPRTALLPILLLASLALAAQTHNLPFGEWTRAANGPILSPQGTTWESAGTFNPATVLHNGKIVMLYRAQDSGGTSRLGYAESTDGLHFIRRPEPVLSPETAYEKTAASKTPASRNSATPTSSPTPATIKRTHNFASPPHSTSFIGNAKA